MKNIVFILVALLMLGVGVTLLPFGCSRNDSENSSGKNTKYHCPMHPTVVSDKPGDCPVCGMRLVSMEEQKPPSQSTTPKPVVKTARFHCPMHPTVVSDKPGDCPICGMKLVQMDGDKHETAATQKTGTMYRSTMHPNEVSAKPGKDSMDMEMEAFEVTEKGTSSVPGLAAVSLMPDARQRMGLTLGTVKKRPLSRNIRTSARISADETRLFRVTTKVEGWVDKLFVSVSGQAVRKGDPLLTIYSPQLVSAQQEYLSALQAAGTLSASPGGDAAEGAKSLMNSARQRLQLWDVSDEQITRLEKTHQVEKTLTLYSPASGFVMEKDILAGQKIMPGEPLMVVADLSVVWGDADIYESDLPYVKVGMPMNLTLSYWPGKTFSGEVSFLSPSLDKETRTLKIRIEIPNPEFLLKLEMYADAKLDYPLGEKLVAPEAAIMRTGERNYVFRDNGEGKLIPVVVNVGVRSAGYYEIISGLNEGDRVVTSANFLVDSESSMRAALESMAGEQP